MNDARQSAIPEFRRRLRASVLLCLLCLLMGTTTGCSSWRASHATAATLFAQGRLAEARDELHSSQEERRAEMHLLHLEEAVLDLADGKPAAAENRLRSTRRVVDHLRQTDAGEQASSIVRDDRAIAWSGRPYERQMLLNLLTMSSLLNDGQDAFAYALQLAELEPESSGDPTSAPSTEPAKQDDNVAGHAVLTASHQHVEPADETAAASTAARNHVLALSAWIRAFVTSESSMRWDECESALADMQRYGAAPEAVAAATGSLGVRCPRGQGGLHVLWMLGQSPAWAPERAEPTTAALLIADRILSATGEHSLPPTVAAVRIPRPEIVPVVPRDRLLQCAVNSGTNGSSPFQRATLVDLNHVAMNEYQATRDAALARAVARRIVKKAAVVATKEVGQFQRNTFADVALNLGGMAWEALEQPDVRSWRTLPARVDVSSTTLPEGTWQLSIADGTEHAVTLPVRVTSGRNTLVVCFVPVDRPIGTVLLGGADRGSFSPSSASADEP